MIGSRGLTFSYGRNAPTLAFNDIHVPAQATLLLVGRSGSGKSTWLALVAGLITPLSGHLEVAGQSLAKLSGRARDSWRSRTIGYLPQRLALSPSLTVEQNLALAYFASGMAVDRAHILNTLTHLDVADLRHARPHQLSGGQSQRVALARALLMRPAVLLVDEPTASLDDESCDAAMGLLLSTARELGSTLVIATHDARVMGACPDARRLTFTLPAASAGEDQR